MRGNRLHGSERVKKIKEMDVNYCGGGALPAPQGGRTGMVGVLRD